MLYLLDNGDDWSTISSDFTTIRYESGATKPLTPSDVSVEIGKYKDSILSDISDVWYLNFIKKISVEKSDIFAQHCVNMRLLELK